MTISMLLLGAGVSLSLQIVQFICLVYIAVKLSERTSDGKEGCHDDR